MATKRTSTKAKNATKAKRSERKTTPFLVAWFEKNKTKIVPFVRTVLDPAWAPSDYDEIVPMYRKLGSPTEADDANLEIFRAQMTLPFSVMEEAYDLCMDALGDLGQVYKEPLYRLFRLHSEKDAFFSGQPIPVATFPESIGDVLCVPMAR